MGDTDRKQFVSDTDIFRHEPLTISPFQQHDLVIPMTVPEKSPRIHHNPRDTARHCRATIRALNYRSPNRQHMRTIQLLNTQCLFSTSRD
ncbi:hypothetical protein VR7878_03778 [Vibrio ruber DSM 16370]|uniref:PIN domain-containing protein n=2 Tax=Vibrio ruber TaxID=184755 RepID=A0A1R4LU05_VIBR1|nr:hypothetical protein VR7878_03778 [Vibrio ruber DSM 16370]